MAKSTYLTEDDFDPTPATPYKSSTLRKAADIPLGFAGGAIGATKALSDAFGANNVVSRGLEGAGDGVNSMLTPEAKAAQRRQGEILDEAKRKGIGEQVGAAGRAFMEAPLQTTAQGLGSVVPFLATAAIPGALPARLAAGAMGAGMGAGTAKGSISEEITKRELAAGKTPEQAAAAADAAQSYTGANADQIALGAGLGVADAAFGVAPAAVGLLRKKLGKEVDDQTFGKAGEGILKAGLKGAAKEAHVEFLQGGQEQVAANIAAQRAGYEAGTFDGAFSQGTLEALASAGPGAGFGIYGRSAAQPANTPPPEQPPAAPATQPATPPAAGPVPPSADATAIGQEQIGGLQRTFDPRAGVEPPLSPTPKQDGGIPYEAPAPKPFGQNFTMQGEPVVERPSVTMGLNPDFGPLSGAAALAVDSGASPAVQGFGLMRRPADFVDVEPITSAAGQIGTPRRLGESPVIDVQAREVRDTELQNQQARIGTTPRIGFNQQGAISGTQAQEAIAPESGPQETPAAGLTQAARQRNLETLKARMMAGRATGAVNAQATPVQPTSPTADAGAAPVDAGAEGAQGGLGGTGAVDVAGQPEQAQALKDVTLTDEGSKPVGADEFSIDTLGWNPQKLGSAYTSEQLNTLYQEVRAKFSNKVVGDGPVDEETGLATDKPLNKAGTKMHEALKKAADIAYQRRKNNTGVPTGQAPEKQPAQALTPQPEPVAEQLPPTDIRPGDKVMVDGKPFTVYQGVDGGIAVESDSADLGDGVSNYQTRILKGDDAIRAKIAADKAGLNASPATVKDSLTTEPVAKPATFAIGRNGTPLAEGGKPFKTKAEADAYRKLQPQLRSKKEGKGYVLVEKTPAQIAAQANAARRLGGVGVQGKPLSAHEFLASDGGLSLSTMADLGFDKNVRIGAKWLFTRTGKTFEGMTEALQQNGYMDGTEQNTAIDLVKRSAKGQPQYTAEGWSRIAEAETTSRFEDHLAAQQEAAQDAEDSDIDPWELAPSVMDDFVGDDLAVAGYDASLDPIKQEFNALLAQADAMGIDTDAIIDQASKDTLNESEQAYYERVRADLSRAINASTGGRSNQAVDGNAAENRGQDAQRGSGADSREGNGSKGAPGTDGQGLTSYTPEELKAQQEAKDKAERTAKAQKAAADEQARRERERKEIAQASVAAADTFELGKDPLQSLSGQSDIFGAAPAAPAPQPAATPAQPEAPKLTPAEAEKLMEWQNMGQTDNVQKHTLFFYESQADKDANRGRMAMATVTKEITGGKAWMVEGDDQKFGALGLAKKRGMVIGMANAKRQGFVVDGEVAAKPEPKKEEAKPTSKTPTVDAHAALMDSVRTGKATPEQFKAGFEAVVAGEDAIKAELGTNTKADLLKMGGPYMQMRYASENKPEIIDATYREMLGEFVLGESLTYGMGKNSYQNAIRQRVEATDADKLAKYVEERKAAIEEAALRRVAAAKAVIDPKTLDDFKAAIRAAMMDGKSRKEAYLSLTPEQRIRYDELDAESTREARESRKRAQKTQVQAAGQTTGGQIIATKHTKAGYDLFVVQLADRLSKEDYSTVLASAKRMGGWYSAFRGNGAIPGFQFKEKASAEAFLKLAGGDTTAAQDQAAQRRDAFEDDRSQTAAERLTEMADRLEAQADEELGRDRKANTARRARFAASAEKAASNAKALAKTMRNIAAAIGEGKAKFLDAVRQKTQVEMLAGVVATAKYNELVARFPKYADREKRNGEPPTIETADFAEFPTFTAFRSDLAGLARQMLDVDGTKKMGQQLMSLADDVTDAYLEFAKKNILAVSQFGRGGAMADFSSKATAEAAIRRSGLVGKAIVLQIKRGENRVILSPSEAMSRGVWKGDGDKRITLTKDSGMELVQAIGRKGNQTNGLKVPWQFETAADRLKALSRMGIETPAEFRSAVREFISLRVQAQEADRVKAMERAMVGRKADGLDFFPTPAEVADQMVEAAEVQAGMRVLEPSAGMGHLADRIRAAGAEPDVVELSGDRRELLEEKGYNVVASDFTTFTAPTERGFTFGDLMRAPDGTQGILRGQGGMGSDRVRLVSDDAGQRELGKFNFSELEGVERRGVDSGYDRIIMNPPFGDRRDAEHVRHAYSLLKPGGRLVAIMGEGVFFGKDKKADEFREWLDTLGGTSEKLPDGSFMDPSLPVTTGVNARMVVIDKPDAGVAMFSQNLLSQKLGPKPTLEQIERFIQRVQDVAKNVIPVTVVGNPAEINVLDVPAGSSPSGALIDGRIYLFSDSIKSVGDAYSTLFHEIFHLGLQRVIPAEAYSALLKQFAANPLVTRFVRQWKKSPEGVEKAGKMPSAAYEALAAEEALAMVSEVLSADKNIGSAKLPGLVKRMLAWFAQVADQSGFPASFGSWIRGLTQTAAERFVSDMTRAVLGGDKNLAKTQAKYGTQATELSSQNRLRGGIPTNTPEFRKWFGDSKVVDADGEPLVMYHGTSKDSDFSRFKVGSRGAWFTSDSESASEYAQENDSRSLKINMLTGKYEPVNSSDRVIPVYLSIKNPYRLTAAEAQRVNTANYAKAQKELFADILARGYDGILWNDNLTKEWVVLGSPTQIKSSIGNNGGFDPKNPDIRFRQSSESLKGDDAFSIKDATADQLAHYRGMGMQALGRRQIIDLYGDLLPELKDYDKLVQQMDSDKNESGAEADKLVTEWAKLDERSLIGVAKHPGMERKLAELMHDATLAQMDPDKPLQPGDDAAKHKALADRFSAMTPKAKEAYRTARDMYADHFRKVQSAIKDRIERSSMDGSTKAKMIAQMDADLFNKLKGVYFPLARFGKYVVVSKNAAGETVSVSRAETLAEANKMRREVVKNSEPGVTVSRVYKDAEFNASRDAVGKGFVADLMTMLQGQGVGEDVLDSVGQLYLASLPDLSWAKHGIHRKGTPGFSQDARRAFAQNMFHGARHLAKLRYSDQLADKLMAMEERVKDQRDDADFDQVKAQQVVDEMNARHELLMNPKTNSISTALTSIGFVWFLGVSPASAMVNLSQTALVAYPVMAAKWGYQKAGAALLSASAEVVRAGNDLGKTLKGDELAAFQQAVDDGTIDVTQAHDLAGVAQGEDERVAMAMRPVMRAASFMFHHAEKFNRQATFIAAYRLAKEAGADTDKAFEQAKKATYDGHFDYSAGNRPRIMQGNWQKVLFLFKQYGQNMVYTLTRQAYLSMKGMTPEQRTEARKQLGGLLAMHAMAAGALGLPIVGMLLSAASMLGSDDDEPWDAEVAMKNMMADTMGPKAAEVMAHGLSRLTPWDLSSRVALNKLILPDVQEGLEGQALWEKILAAAAGPVAAIPGGFFKGMAEMGQGHYQRGLESMLPVAMRNVVKADRFADEGAVDKTGIVIKDEVSAAGLLGQASGFRPSEVALATEGRMAIYQADKALTERRSSLVRMYAQARMSGDIEGAQEVLAMVKAYNTKNPKRAITMVNLNQSVRARNRRIENADQGVYLPQNRRDAQEAGRFAVAAGEM